MRGKCLQQYTFPTYYKTVIRGGGGGGRGEGGTYIQESHPYVCHQSPSLCFNVGIFENVVQKLSKRCRNFIKNRQIHGNRHSINNNAAFFVFFLLLLLALTPILTIPIGSVTTQVPLWIL